MKKIVTIRINIFLTIIFLITFSCTPPTPKDLGAESLIPKPVELTATGSSFRLKQDSKITFSGNSEELRAVANHLAKMLRPATGFELPVESDVSNESNGNIHLVTSTNDINVGGAEGYQLTITEKTILIEANRAEGVFRSLQSIRQLLPPSIESSSVQAGPWEIASGTIVDYPQYAYRGAMLDVARHFLRVSEVKQYIDWLAQYKMNVLHLHLTDDQGWRIEVKKWPKLTEIGGSTEVGGAKGGFYTQEEYQEIVAYAKDRYIMIIPEVDMPGHTNSALASYAELNCDNKLRELYTGTEVGFSTFCTDKEIVYEFIDDVVREISNLTPGPYFHIGGDESHVTATADYQYFMKRVQDIVSKNGKQALGWDEIASTQMQPGTVAQIWNSHERAQDAVAKGNKVIMSPAQQAYLDMKYDSTTELGLSWAGYIEVDHGYNWYPEELIEGVTIDHILGVEAPLWSETVTNMQEIEYLVFPRLLGYAEIGWSASNARKWEEYRVRLGKQSARFKQMQLNYYPSELVNWEKDETEELENQ